jgi:hypothetical protein
MMVVENIWNGYNSFTLNFTKNYSWLLNDLSLRYNINLLCRILPYTIVTTGAGLAQAV